MASRLFFVSDGDYNFLSESESNKKKKKQAKIHKRFSSLDRKSPGAVVFRAPILWLFLRLSVLLTLVVKLNCAVFRVHFYPAQGKPAFPWSRASIIIMATGFTLAEGIWAEKRVRKWPPVREGTGECAIFCSWSQPGINSRGNDLGVVPKTGRTEVSTKMTLAITC